MRNTFGVGPKSDQPIGAANMKRNREPDLRLNHRDPAMPVIRPYVMADGTKREIVDPEYESRYRAHLIDHAPYPDWKSDPTYNMNRKAKPNGK